MSSTKKDIKVVCFGEVLFDVFTSHTKIGGAPLNVALRLASLGINSQIISKIGDDTLGKELLDYIKENKVSTATIQTDDTLTTGKVIVSLNENGSASYTINYPVAWDKIEATPEAKKTVANSNAFIFGSLASRDSVSQQSLLELIPLASYKIFDVNLRAPFYNEKLLVELMNKADFIKFNDDELLEISTFMGSTFNLIEQNIFFIAEKTNTKHICVTRGSEGAVLYYDEKLYNNDGFKITVADTVGAGDSFLAGLLSKLLAEESPQNAIDFACALGALVAQKEGANPKINKSTIDSFMNPINKTNNN